MSPDVTHVDSSPVRASVLEGAKGPETKSLEREPILEDSGASVFTNQWLSYRCRQHVLGTLMAGPRA